MRFLYDTDVFVYALGAPHPYREACRAVVADQRDGTISGEASTAIVQEFCHQRRRQTQDRERSAGDAATLASGLVLHDLTRQDIETAVSLYATHDRLDAIDAVFAATAQNRGIDVILSTDRGFDGVEGLRRVDPLDAVAVADLRR